MPERVLLSAEIKPREILGYDPSFDIEAYRSARPDNLNQLNLRTRINLETMLGERFNVELSRVEYLIENHQLKSPLHNEPFVEVIKRGQKYRREAGSKDTPREDAEVEGFIKVQAYLTSPAHQNEEKLIVISPKGKGDSIYQHNFFDVYQKTNGGKIRMSRYTSRLSYQQFTDAAKTIDPFVNLPQNPTDAHFLANPLVTQRSLSEITQIISPLEKTMPIGVYNQLIEACTPLTTAYINALTQNQNEVEIYRIYRSLLKFSDIYTGADSAFRQLPALINSQVVTETINELGYLTLRAVAAGCGSQKGFSAENPLSVSDFGYGEDQYGTRKIHCEECGATYQRDSGKLEKSCRNCSGTKGIAC